MDLIFYLS